MRTYIVILDSIPSTQADSKFAEMMKKNKFEWWRYTALNWIVITPDTYGTSTLLKEAFLAYGEKTFIVVLEININDAGGAIPPTYPGLNVLAWFEKIKDPSFIPAWEK